MSHEFAKWLAIRPNSPGSTFARTDSSLPLLIVGAGPAGLAGMAALKAAGLPFECVESHRQVGGIWDASNPLSSVYEGLRTVTSRHTSHLGRPVPNDWPDYVPHEKVLEYMTCFAESEDLVSRIRFETRYESAEKTPQGTWRVRLHQTGQDSAEHRDYRAIVFATGAHNRLNGSIPPRLKEQAAMSGIEVLHSADYQAPAAYAGKRVLIVGVGNSGSDIAEKISAVAPRVLLSIRTTPWINPLTVQGVPCDKLAADSASLRLPEWFKLSWFHMLRRFSVGSFRRLGLTTPKHGLNDRLPISDRGIVKAILSGKVIVRSDVTGFENGQALFANPRHPPEPIDVAIFATGFSRHYPFLSAANGHSSVSDALTFLTFHRSEPGLVYLAEVVGLRSCWPIFLEQGRAIAAYFMAEQQVGQNVDEFNLRRGFPSPDCKGKLFRRTDGFHVDYDVYTRVMRDLTKWLSE